MSRATVGAPRATVDTLREALRAALRSASEHNSTDTVAPAAVLWTDRERWWESVVPELREGLPLLTLGAYEPRTLTGPAIWLRCALAGTLPELKMAEGTPIVYLPGVGRPDLRAVEDCPGYLRPLAELQYRGAVFTHRNGKDWTPAAFLGNVLGVEVAADAATRTAMARVLPKLLEEPVEALAARSPLAAPDLDALLVPDHERDLLLWLDDPGGYERTVGSEVRAAFRDLCAARYGFDPDADGALEAVGQLVEGKGAWKAAWRRYAEAPGRYPNLPVLLDRVGSSGSPTLFESASPFRPRDNRAEENRLREALLGLGEAPAPEARERLRKLEAEHGSRREWVWAELGRSPLARALVPLVALADATANTLGAGTPADIAERYASGGWKVDLAAIKALAAGNSAEDSAALRAAVRSTYEEWLDECARRFQKAIAAGPVPNPDGLDPQGPRAGSCILFTDGLRYDVGRLLVEALEEDGAAVASGWRFAALPGVTSTAKPALSPARPLLGPGAGFGAVVQGKAVTATSLRRLLEERGYQVLKGDETGAPSLAASAWTEGGDLDNLGHNRGWKMALDIERSVKDIASRVIELLAAGWREVRVVTDHGWLLLPGGLPKMDLPEHLTVVRKGRCARLKEGISPETPSVSWTLDPDVTIAIAPGIAAYEAGNEYAHGGLSPQECVVPVLTVNHRTVPSATITEVRWTGLRCKVRVEDAPEGAKVDLRARAADPSTSFTPAKPLKDGAASLPVADDTREFEAAIIVVVGRDGRVLAQSATVVGG